MNESIIDNDDVSTACVKCGQEAGEPEILCVGCQEQKDEDDREAHAEATSCPSCGCPNTGGDICDGCDEVNREEAPRE